MGTPDTAVPSLEAILAAGHDVPLVITRPDRPVGRSKTPQPPPVKVQAVSLELRVEQPASVRADAFFRQLAETRPDVIAVVAYGRILPRPVLEVAPLGAINLHFSLLPAYRGAAPVPWALARGESETGLTIFRLDEGLDAGQLLAQRRVPIVPGEHAPVLLARLAVDGAALLVETLAGLGAGSIRPEPQDERLATTAPLLTRQDGSWSASWSARDLEGRVRGFDPWPGVWASIAGKRLRIVEAAAEAGRHAGREPGLVVEATASGLRVACADGTIAVVTAVQLAGGRPMAALAAVNGRLLAPGDRFGPPEPAA